MKQILILSFQGILVHADNLPVPEARGTRQVFIIYKHISKIWCGLNIFTIFYPVCAGKRALDQRAVLLRHRGRGREGQQGADQVNVVRAISYHVLI